MSVRISTQTSEDRLTVQVEGRLQSPDAVGLKKKYGRSAPRLTLDLAGLLSADETALEVLVEFEAAGAELKGASTYVRYLLERMSSHDFPVPDLTLPIG